MRPNNWAYAGEVVALFYPDGTTVNVKKTVFDRAFRAIINATKEDVIRDFAVAG